MVVDVESILDEEFDRASQVFRIYEDGTIAVKEDYQDAPWREQVLIHFIGRQYAAVGGKVNSSLISYDYLYARFDKDDSTIRRYIGELEDESLVEKDQESGDWRLVLERLPNVLDRIEGDDS